MQEQELLYHVAGDGGAKRRVPRPLASATIKLILYADAAVDVPSTSRNTLAHHAVIPQLKFVNVCINQPPLLPSIAIQLGYESKAEKDYRYWPNANHEGDPEKVQERISDWNTKRGEGAYESVNMRQGQS
ncbi:MAG: hypothetical protein Q9216_001670 [Gyalolechia sp. 2 TL-2023]